MEKATSATLLQHTNYSRGACPCSLVHKREVYRVHVAVRCFCNMCTQYNNIKQKGLTSHQSIPTQFFPFSNNNITASFT